MLLLRVQAAIQKLQELKGRALEQLQQEKLEVNESFTIFLDLVHHGVEKMEKKLEESS